ncbi:MAG: type I glyceraldehyde-3-phosphate dehydrogenase [Pseudomonadota bacterium]
MVRLAVNGLGRIGRCVIRAIFELNRENDIELVAVNGTAAIENFIHLLKYDSTHGRFNFDVKAEGDYIIINNKKIKYISQRDPLQLPWQELDVEILLECTGIFKDIAGASKHIEAGAKKVLISAPAKDNIPMLIYGVNNEIVQSEQNIFSIGSCTTNCLAPIVKIIDENIGIENAFMTTIHAYTNDQNIVDNNHKDLRRARTASSSMIPTATGAAKALSVIFPDLAGKFDGVAIRVPTANVSMVDLKFNAKNATTIEEINNMMQNAAKSSMLNVLAYNDEPLVSVDFNHDPHSAIFDATGTKVINDKLCRIAAWYDNEWGFSVRMLDAAQLLLQNNSLNNMNTQIAS